MKKIKQLVSLACAFISVILASLLTACEKESSISLIVKSDDGEFNPLWLIPVGVVLIIAVLVALKVSSSKKKARELEEAEASAEVMTQDPNAVSEYIFDEERKAAAEDSSEEKAEAAEEEKSEDAAEEKAEDTAEENADAAEEEKAEDAPEEKAVEEIVEEVADANFVSDASDKADVTAEENADNAEAAVEENADETEYTIGENGLPVAPEGKVIRYKWSFLARLIQSDDELKYRYMMLRRKLLSYKNVRSNVSWNFDSYFIGRKPIVKLKVRGKTLVAYFPRDPKEMQGTKYVGEDISGISRYKAVPFAYRINGMRKLKYAIELIEEQLEGIKSTDPIYIEESQVNEAIPRESLKKLYEKGYVRVGGILAVGDRASAQDDDDEDVVDVDVNEIDEEVAPSALREEFNFNPKAQ